MTDTFGRMLTALAASSLIACATGTVPDDADDGALPTVATTTSPASITPCGVPLNSAASCGANHGTYCDWAPGGPQAYACWNRFYISTSDCPRCCGAAIDAAFSCLVGQYSPLSGYNNGGLSTHW